MIFWSSCREDFQFESNTGNLSFSKDTVFLDTVFTNIGSSTYTLKVYNDLNKDISIPFVGLQSGPESQYRLNVDGVAGKEFTNVPLLAKDSLFVFIETTFDIAPTNENEFLHTDELIFGIGPAVQQVALVTLVKDAIFLYPATNSEGVVESVPIGLDEEGNETFIDGFYLDPSELSFTNEKPYVVYGYAAVPEGSTLSIDAGARVHFHKDSGILVESNASININGQLSEDRELMENEVIFEGDRLEPSFSDVPGQWGGIWIREGSIGNTFDHLTLKNASAGILLEGNPTNTDLVLTMNNCQITNSSAYNLWSSGTNTSIGTSVFGGAGNTSVFLGGGGSHSLTQCTIANYWGNGPRQGVALALNNMGADVLNTSFTNSIIDGSSRLELSLVADPAFQFDFTFINCAIKLNDTNGSLTGNPLYDFFNTAQYLNPLLNGDMDFEAPFQNVFIIGPQSDAIDQGNPDALINFPLDIQGNPRTGNPDLGAFENIPDS